MRTCTKINFTFLQQANLQSTAVKEYTYRVEDTMRRVHNIQVALEQLHAKADDINKMTDTVWDAGDLIAAQAKHTRPRLAAIRDKHLRTGLILEVRLLLYD